MSDTSVHCEGLCLCNSHKPQLLRFFSLFIEIQANSPWNRIGTFVVFGNWAGLERSLGACFCLWQYPSFWLLARLFHQISYCSLTNNCWYIDPHQYHQDLRAPNFCAIPSSSLGVGKWCYCSNITSGCEWLCELMTPGFSAQRIETTLFHCHAGHEDSYTPFRNGKQKLPLDFHTETYSLVGTLPLISEGIMSIHTSHNGTRNGSLDFLLSLLYLSCLHWKLRSLLNSTFLFYY